MMELLTLTKAFYKGSKLLTCTKVEKGCRLETVSCFQTQEACDWLLALQDSALPEKGLWTPLWDRPPSGQMQPWCKCVPRH